MFIIDTLKDKLGTVIYPKTRTDAIFDEEGTRLDNKITSIDGDITQINQNLTWSDTILLSTIPHIEYRTNGILCEVYVNTITASYSSETTIGSIPYKPIFTERLYIGNGYINIGIDGIITVDNIASWSVANFVYSI